MHVLPFLQITNTTDPNVPLIPPPIATPTISYSSTGERNGSTSSDSPYLLTDTVRNDTYTFTVTVTNVAGVSSTLSNEVSGVYKSYASDVILCVCVCACHGSVTLLKQPNTLIIELGQKSTCCNILQCQQNN